MMRPKTLNARLSRVLAALALAGAAHAQPAPGTTVLPVPVTTGAPLSVTADRADWLYPLGARAQLRLRAEVTPLPDGGLPIRYRLGPEMLDSPEREVRVPREGLVLDVDSPAQPGFVRLVVRPAGADKPTLVTLGFGVEQIRPTQADPADFDAFWARQQAELAQVPPEFRLTPAPALSTATVEVFHLRFKNVGGWAGASHIHGVLAVPRPTTERPGPFPALLTLPGAGVRGYRGNLAMAERGFITLQMGIHGLPVDLPAEVYDDLSKGALSDYARFNLDNKDGYYYRRVYLGALRASHYLAQHPQWDGRKLLVSGGSQGGQLALVVAALNPQVDAVAVHYPAYSDVSGYLHGRAGGWPGLFRQRADGSVGDAPVAPKLATTAYYDSVNFARRVRVPSYCGFGFNDDVTPPTSTFAACNSLATRQVLLLAPAQGHTPAPEQAGAMTDWLLRQARP